MLRFGFTHNYVESIDKYLFQVLFTAKKVFHPYFWSVTFTLQNPETTPAAIPYCELKNITNVKALNAIYHVWNYIHDGGKSEFCLTAAFIVPPRRKRLLADKM